MKKRHENVVILFRWFSIIYNIYCFMIIFMFICNYNICYSFHLFSNLDFTPEQSSKLKGSTGQEVVSVFM